MSYQVLARKWRPQRFSELVGQNHVVSAITHALENNRLHHAYLFSGTRGVGKTTIARIFAKSLNCEEGQSANPCGRCDTCLSIEQGHYVDLLEIDAASRTKVEDTRELLDNVQYKPTRGDYKVYLIDEVHMLSKHSFNALLKTLEEPPPHVKFLLATTDPQKLPVTILSRCLQFNLKALSREQISEQLAHILTQESIPYDNGGIDLLARAANGSMRDALSLTDQAIAQGDNQVAAKIVADMLGLMDKQLLIKLLHAIVSNDKAAVLAGIEKIAEQAPDYANVLAELSSLLHQIALTQWVPEACKLETTSAKALYQLAKSIPPEHVQLLYKFVLEGKQELAYSIDGKTCLEMTAIRMMSFSPIAKLSDTNSVVQQPPTIAVEPELAQASVQAPATAQEQPPFPEPQVDNQFDQGYAVAVQDEIHHPPSHMDDEQRLLETAKQEAIAPPRVTAEASPQQSPLERTKALLARREQLSGKSQSEEVADTGKKPVELKLPTNVRSTSAVAPSEPVENETPPPWVLHSGPESQVQPAAQQQSNEQKPDITEAKADEPQLGEQLAQVVSHSDYVLSAYLENGEKLTAAQQLDSWSKLVETTSLTGLTKQIALHSSCEQSNNQFQLILDDAQSHLLNDSAVAQITQAIEQRLSTAIKLDIEIGKPINTPFQIQQDINKMRYAHATRIVESDDKIQSLTRVFEAAIDESSIQPR